MVDKYALIREMKQYAEVNNVPIMMDEGIDFLTTFILKNHVKNILEIGTAIGYSAIMMALVDPNVKITTIERDEIRYLEALKNVKAFGLENRITLIYNDAFNVKLDEKFDLIFIDAAKAQNIKFFEMFERNLEYRGVIITDNLKFHGLVDKKEEEIKSKNLRALARKIKDYVDYLKTNEKYNTEFFEVGDGISVSTRK